VEGLGGTLLQALESVKVRALPADLPERFEISVDGLVEFESIVHVRDLAVPADVTLLTDGDEMIARVMPPRVEVVEVAEVSAVEGAEAASDVAADAEASEES